MLKSGDSFMYTINELMKWYVVVQRQKWGQWDCEAVGINGDRMSDYVSLMVLKPDVKLPFVFGADIKSVFSFFPSSKCSGLY